MSRSGATFLGLGVFLMTMWLEVSMQTPSASREEEGLAEAMQALDQWTASRAYPSADIPPDRYYRAYSDSKTMRKGAGVTAPPRPWTSIGPVNFAGRTLAIVINPLNPNSIYIGTAAGGLWRSHTGGLGGDWERVVTGFPVLAVNAIALDPIDTSTMYIGTGEVYRYGCSNGGMVVRTTRGSYGIGILKTTNSGTTWTMSLDWSRDQRRGVEGLLINPLNPSTVLAATSEGVYRSTDAGTTWTLVLNVLLAQQLVMNPADTAKVLVTCGDFASSGRGVYRSTNGGVTFNVIPSLPGFTGKAALEVYGANPWTVYASLADSMATGSLWKSTNFGSTWTLISNQAINGVQGWYTQVIAVQPADSMLMVRGSMYLLKSTDGGISYYQFPYLGSPWADFHAWAHHPTNPNILYIVDDAGVWRSADFGSTYQAVNGGLRTTQFFNGFSCSEQDSNRALGQVQDRYGWMYTGSLNWVSSGADEAGWTAINPSNDYIMYACDRNGVSIYKSTNRGVSFSSMAGVPSGSSAWNTPLALSRSNANCLYFGRAVVYKSTNAGVAWAATNGGAALDGNLPLSMAVAPTSQDTVFVGTVPGTGRVHLFRTTNAGASWNNVTGDLPNRYPIDIAIDPIDSRIVYVAFGGFDTTRVAKSTNAGLTWTHISSPLPNVPTTAVAIDPFRTSHVYVGNDLGVFVSTNAGATWSDYNEGLYEAVTVGDLVISPSDRSIKLASHGSGVFTRKLLSTTMTGVAESQTIPPQFVLYQNYPNPFNPTTAITYTLPVETHVRLAVYNAVGQRVAQLVDGSMTAGVHQVVFDAAQLASGIYFYRLEAGSFTGVRKILLLK